MIRDSPNKNDPSNSSLEKSSKVCLELHSLKLAAHPEDQWLEDESSFWGQKVYFQGQAASFREGYLFAKVDHSLFGDRGLIGVIILPTQTIHCQNCHIDLHSFDSPKTGNFNDPCF